jgi:hypothetical protein
MGKCLVLENLLYVTPWIGPMLWLRYDSTIGETIPTFPALKKYLKMNIKKMFFKNTISEHYEALPMYNDLTRAGKKKFQRNFKTNCRDGALAGFVVTSSCPAHSYYISKYRECLW